jgi:hypothetical protein
MSPPPSNTWHLHIAQEPLPPHADGRKIFWLLSAISRLLPMSTSGDFAGSSLMSSLTLPFLTSFFSQNISTATRSTMTPVRATTPVRIVVNIVDLDQMPLKVMKAIATRPVVMNVMPRPRSGPGMLAVRMRQRIVAMLTIASAQPRPEPKP